MKEVIYLEPDEEITSIIDKIKAIENTSDIILVAPKSASLIQSVVNLKLLKKEAKTLKKDVSLVTEDNIGRSLASQVGIAVFETIDSDKPIIEPAKEEPNLNETIEIDMSEKNVDPPPGVKVHHYDGSEEPKAKDPAQKAEPKTHSVASPISVDKYKEPKTAKPQKSKKLVKILLISLAAILAGSILFYFYYPRATINLVIKAEPVEEKIKIVADTSIKKASADNNAIPGEIISTNSEISEQFTATGEKNVGQKASGSVTLSNGTGNVIDVASGTQLESNSGLYFTTTSPASVPAATASVDGEGNVIKNPGTVDIGVEAKESGDNYNIGPTGFSVINYSSLSASNSNSFTGGTSEKIKIVSQDDVDQAYIKLTSDLEEKLKDALVSQVGDKKLSLISSAIEYIDENFTTSVNAGDEAEQFSAGLLLGSKTIAFNEENYKNLIVSAIGDKIPEDKELVLSADDEISQGDYELDFGKGVLTIEGTIKTKLAPKINDDEIKKEIKGKNILKATDILKLKNTLFKNVTIDIKPSWISKIPSRVKAINLIKTYDVK